MKSLKRTLCLVLALVMVLGLFGIASATNFTDDNDVQYKEAVDVMTGVGAINGMGDGTFNPKGTITRAAAAKLVTYAVLGKATAERLTGVSSSFTDVTVDGGFAWAIPSIEYLVKAGVINGMGDGTFNPNGEISSTATLKMLLCALGYGAKGEYTGTGWDFKVTLDANKYGLTTGRTSTASVDAAATREEVALYCFNTIQKGTVKYVSTLDIYVDNTTGTGENEKAVTIMNTVYGGTGALEKDTVKTTDAYGRPANVWNYKGETICTAAQKPVLTYTTDLKAADFELAVKNAGYKLDAVDSEGDAILEGYFLNNNKTAGTALQASGKVGGKGTLTEVFANDAKAVTKVVMTQTNLTEVTAYGEDKAATTTVDERSLTVATTGDPIVVTAEDKVEGFDAVYTVAKIMIDSGKNLPVLAVFDMENAPTLKVVALSVPQSADVEVTSVKNVTEGKETVLVSFVAGGKTYEIGAGKVADKLADIAVGKTITIAMDKYGYVLGAEVVKSTTNLGVVIDYGTDGAAFVGSAKYQLKLIGLDGKEIILPVSKVGGVDLTAENYESSLGDLVKDIVSYAPDGENEGQFDVANDDNFVEIAKGGDAFTLTTGKVDIADGIVANDETVFIIKDENNKYNSYVGIKNVPSMTVAVPEKDDGRGVAIYEKLDAKGAGTGVAAVVYVTGGEATGSGTQNAAFIAVDKAGGVVTLKGGQKVYDAAIIDKSGVKAIQILQSVVDSEKTPFIPVVTGYTLNSDGTVITKTTGLKAIGDADTGNVLGSNVNKDATAGYGISKAVKGNITFTVSEDGKTTLTRSTASDCVVWVIDPSKTDATEKFQLKSVAQIAADTNDMVFWIEDAESTVVSAIYIVKVADDGGKTEDTSFSVTKPVFETESAKISNVTITAVTTSKVEKNGDYIFKVTAADSVDKNYTVSVTSTKGTVTYCATENGSYASTELATTKNQESSVFVKVSGLDTDPTITVTLTEKA